jgi:translation initiation factor IF-2
MRSRGAQVTDIVVLVVAANDGVMPQTIESIQHIKASGVQYIVAINKIDLPDANSMHVKTQLAEHEVFVEGFGGNISCVEVSAKSKLGIPELLEMILLMADVADLKADPEAPFEGVVIESGKDQRKGVLATVLVKQGTLKVKSQLFSENSAGKVRFMSDALGKVVTTVLPGAPASVSGFDTVPMVGSVVLGVPLDVKIESQDGAAKVADGQEKLSFILKADVAGSLEALKSSLGDTVQIVASGVGEISESDVMLAETMKAKIIGFNVGLPKSLQLLAEAHGVRMKTYKIIYDLLEDVAKQVEIFTNPNLGEEEVGVAEVVQIFDIRGDKVAGSKVKTGEITRGQQYMFHWKRGDAILGDVRVKSLKQAKLDVDSVKAPGECGIVLRGNPDFQAGDTIVCYTKKEII